MWDPSLPCRDPLEDPSIRQIAPHAGDLDVSLAIDEFLARRGRLNAGEEVKVNNFIRI